MRIAAPEPSRVESARRLGGGEQTHVLVGRGHELGAEDRLQRCRATAPAPGHPTSHQPHRGRKRAPVKPLDDLHQAILLPAIDLPVELTHPGSLAIALPPRRHGVGQQVKLHAAVALTRPHIGQRPSQLRVPQQRRQVIDRDRHADMVDRAVGCGPDRQVGERLAAKQPDVAGRRGLDRVLERDRGAACHSNNLRKRCGCAGSCWVSRGSPGLRRPVS